MPIDDDTPHAAPRSAMPPLDRLGVEELRAHVQALQAEIAQAEAEIRRKEGLRNAADSVFRRP